MSVNTLIVQANDGDDPKLQANAHVFMLIRGVITAAILLLAGSPLAELFKVPQAAWAFQLMAVAPIIRGFAHQDLWRYHRKMRFVPLAAAEFYSQVVALAATWPLVVLLGDYSVMLWVILIQISVVTIWSHLVHERPYRLSLDRIFIRRIVSFGWPLLINGFLILSLNYGDRAVIAIFPAYSMSDVGLFMVATTVVLMPMLLVSKLATTILLPALSKVQNDPVQFGIQFDMVTGCIGLVSILQTIFLIIAGPSLTVVCFGEKYLPVASFLGWLSAGSGVRVLRLAPMLGALALGDSRNPMIANIARCSGFIVAILAATFHGDLYWFGIAALVGELVSYFVSLVSLRYRMAIRSSISTFTVSLLIGSICVSMGVYETVCGPTVMWIVPLAVASGVAVSAMGLAACIFQPFRNELNKLGSILGLRRPRIGL